MNKPSEIKIEECKRLFDSLKKSQKHCFLFLIFCIMSKKTPIIQGPTASGKSYLLNIFSIILGQETNLYQMNSSEGMSFLSGQEIVRQELYENEIENLQKAYNTVKKIINFKKKFNDIDFKDCKKMVSKIDKKLKDENFEEEEKEDVISNLKKYKKSIVLVTLPQNRIIHYNSEFIDSIIKVKVIGLYWME